MNKTINVERLGLAELEKIPAMDKCNIGISNAEEFIDNNFCVTKVDGLECLLCDSNVPVPLCKFVYDFILSDNELVKQGKILINSDQFTACNLSENDFGELEASPIAVKQSINPWLWDEYDCDFDSADCLGIVQCLIDSGIILTCKNTTKYKHPARYANDTHTDELIIFPDFRKYLVNSLDRKILDEIALTIKKHAGVYVWGWCMESGMTASVCLNKKIQDWVNCGFLDEVEISEWYDAFREIVSGEAYIVVDDMTGSEACERMMAIGRYIISRGCEFNLDESIELFKKQLE